MVIGNQGKYKAYKVVLHTFFIIMSSSFIIPLLAVISISLSNEVDIENYGFRLIPKNIDISAYSYIFKNPDIIVSAYKVTIITTLIGTLLYLIMASMCAYPLSRRDFKYRNTITFYLFFTMLFNGGLVPYYIMMTKYFHLRDTYAALILPLLSNVWYVLLMRTFFQQLPTSIIESATIDGASEFKIYIKMIIPLSTPVLATVGLLQLLNFWNSWYPALLYVNNDKMYPLQYLLQVMLRNIQDILDNMEKGVGDLLQANQLPTESTRMAMCILAVGPMLFIFPFFQKYFSKGLTVGSVKG